MKSKIHRNVSTKSGNEPKPTKTGTIFRKTNKKQKTHENDFILLVGTNFRGFFFRRLSTQRQLFNIGMHQETFGSSRLCVDFGVHRQKKRPYRCMHTTFNELNKRCSQFRCYFLWFVGNLRVFFSHFISIRFVYSEFRILPYSMAQPVCKRHALTENTRRPNIVLMDINSGHHSTQSEIHLFALLSTTQRTHISPFVYVSRDFTALTSNTCILFFRIKTTLIHMTLLFSRLIQFACARCD